MDKVGTHKSTREARIGERILPETGGAAPHLANGYRMIESIALENFRSFKDLKLSGFRTINILVGPSASGKTAFLEAVRLGLGATPQLAYTMSVMRGMIIPFAANMSRQQFESVWSHYFFDFDTAISVGFRVADSAKRTATLKMFFDEKKAIGVLPNNPNIQPLLTTFYPLMFERVSFSGQRSILQAAITPQGAVNIQQGPDLGASAEFFPSTWQSNAPQVAQWFSQLSIAGKSEDVVDAVHTQFSEITDLATEQPYAVSAIYATVAHRKNKMPITLISSGINKFISMLIAIKIFSGGVILIDEIENGIYFEMFPAMWRALHDFAIKNNTQLFVSTHSWECLKAAATLENFDTDFSLIQVFNENGESKALLGAGKGTALGIKNGIDPRR